MTAQELTAYWQELAKKAGLPEEKAKSVVEALSDETVSKAFADGFRTAPEYNRGLDKNKSEWETKVQEAAAESLKWKTWLEETGKPAYEQNLKGIDALRKYQEKFGSLDGDDPPPVGDPPKDVLTRKELDEINKQRDQATINLIKSATLIGADYSHRFKEPLSAEKLAELEKVAVDGGMTLDTAYKSWIAPRVHDLEMKDIEARHEKEKEELRKDLLSQHNLPVDNKPPEYHPFFNKDKVEGEPDAAAKRAASKEAFTRGWAESG